MDASHSPFQHSIVGPDLRQSSNTQRVSIRRMRCHSLAERGANIANVTIICFHFALSTGGGVPSLGTFGGRVQHVKQQRDGSRGKVSCLRL